MAALKASTNTARKASDTSSVAKHSMSTSLWDPSPQKTSFFSSSCSSSSSSSSSNIVTPSKIVYASVSRQLPKSKNAKVLSECFEPDASEVAVALGRKAMQRKAPPGWDDIHTDGWRAVKLPVHDLTGATCYVVVFGGEFDGKRAQAIVERFALMLGPMTEELTTNPLSTNDLSLVGDGNGRAATSAKGASIDSDEKI